MRDFVGANYYAPMNAISEVIAYEPKIVQCTQCFNEEAFIWYALKSIYNEVDYIRVVEGAVENQVNATEDGHSTDNTVKIITLRTRDLRRNRAGLPELDAVSADQALSGGNQP